MWHLAITDREMKSQYGWTPPKHPISGPSVPKGQQTLPGMAPDFNPEKVITPTSRPYKHRDDQRVWGFMARGGSHNPFLDGHLDQGPKVDSIGPHDPALRGQAEDVLKGVMAKAHPCIAIGTDALSKSLDDGRLKSQFETNTSGGWLDQGRRSEVEHNLMGYPEGGKTPDHERPIYGHLAHDPIKNDVCRPYGDHTVVLHKPSIWHRTSVTVGDSLDNRDHIKPSPTQSPKAHSVSLRLFGSHDDSGDKLMENISNLYSVDGAGFGPIGGYTEAQYHGGVTKKDIHYVVVRGQGKQTADLKSKLDEHGVPWIHHDGYSDRVLDHSDISNHRTAIFRRMAISNAKMKEQYGWAPPRHKAREEGATLRSKPLTEADPEYHKWGDKRVWGVMAEGHHNPFLNGHTEGTLSQSQPSGENFDGLHEDHMDWDPEVHTAVHERARKRLQSQVDKTHPCISINSDALKGVLGDGRFKSQFETGRSQGALDFEGRENTEHAHFGYPVTETYDEDEDDGTPGTSYAEHAGHASHARPIYGYLAHDPVKNDTARQYGSHTVVLHKPSVWHRTTASVGDSLGYAEQMTPSPTQHMQPHAVMQHQFFGTPGEQYQDDQQPDPGAANLHRTLHNLSKGYTADADLSGYRRQGSYTEAQYHGGVSKHDIHYVVLRHKPWEGQDSTDEIKSHLNREGIPWVHVDHTRQVVDHSGNLSKQAVYDLESLGYNV